MKKYMTDLQILGELRILFDKKENWARGILALDKYNKPCNPTDSVARQWCIFGGLAKVQGLMHDDSAVSWVQVPKSLREGISINDALDGVNTTHTDIVAAIDMAIDRELIKYG